MTERPAIIDRRQYKIIALVFAAIYIVTSFIALFYIMGSVLDKAMNPQKSSSVEHYGVWAPWDMSWVPPKMLTGMMIMVVGGLFGTIAIFIYDRKLRVDSSRQKN